MLLQDEHRAFRRQLEDKRPVVESNLLSGRQYIANEPPLSDTSDSEGTWSADAEISVGLCNPQPVCALCKLSRAPPD